MLFDFAIDYLLFVVLCVYRWSPTTFAVVCLTLCLSPSVFLSLAARLSVHAVVQQHAYMFASRTSRSIMEVKERRPYCSLTKSRRDREGPYTGEITLYRGNQTFHSP